MHASGRQASVLGCTDILTLMWANSGFPGNNKYYFYIRSLNGVAKLSPRNNHLSVLSLTVAELSCQVRQTPACP